MNVVEKLGDKANELKSTAKQARYERLYDSNLELKRDNKLLRDQLGEVAADRRRMLDMLERMEMTPRKRKRGGLIRAVLVAGVAYVLGARAGRERFEQIRAAWGRIANRPSASDALDGVRDVSRAAKDQVRPIVQTIKGQVGPA